MGYIFNQYNHPQKEDNGFLTYVKEGIADRKKRTADVGVSGDGGFEFEDECVKIPGKLLRDNIYFFHGKIKRMDSTQTFDIKLVNFNNENDTDEQYLKTIDIRQGANNDSNWVDVQFVFTPAKDFEGIVFELRRIQQDYSGDPRIPIIIYQELSIVNNIMETHLKNSPTELLKIGVQSHPGLLMCINSEPIYIGKAGIYEIRNGVIKVTMFSIISPAKEAREENGKNYIEVIQEALALYGPNKIVTSSVCLFDTEKTRTIDAFTLDYMYEMED